MKAWKIIGGVVVGIGAVAVAPITGGGSLLGAATLVGSLTGASGLATAAGVAGGAAGVFFSKKEKQNKIETQKNTYEEGLIAGQNKVIQKFQLVINDLKKRDQLILLVTKIGIHVAKCDGELSEEELLDVKGFLGHVNSSSLVPDVVKNGIKNIIEQDISFEQIVNDTRDFLSNLKEDEQREVLVLLNELIFKIIESDIKTVEAEKLFLSKWKNEFNYD